MSKEELKQDWLRALRSGEYDQGMGVLRIDRAGPRREHCCLGVLCEIYEHATPLFDEQSKFLGYATYAEDRDQQVVIHTDLSKTNLAEILGLNEKLSAEDIRKVRALFKDAYPHGKWAYLQSRVPDNSIKADVLIGANDAGFSFEFVAAVIEALV